jgi:hypothetical protein
VAVLGPAQRQATALGPGAAHDADCIVAHKRNFLKLDRATAD